MRVIFMYDQDEPVKGSITPGSLPNPQTAYKGYKPLLITQRLHDGQLMASRNMLIDASASATGNSNNNNIVTSNQLHIFEALNEDVRLPQGDDTLYWCKVFEFEDFSQKQHLVKVSGRRGWWMQIRQKIDDDDDSRKIRKRKVFPFNFCCCRWFNRETFVCGFWIEADDRDSKVARTMGSITVVYFPYCLLPFWTINVIVGRPGCQLTRLFSDPFHGHIQLQQTAVTRQ